MGNCQGCGKELLRRRGPGRPRKRCEECAKLQRIEQLEEIKRKSKEATRRSKS